MKADFMKLSFFFFFYACLSVNINLVNYLIKYDADINKECEEEVTQLFGTFCSGKIFSKYLIEKGVDVNKESEDTGEASLFMLVVIEMKIY